MARSASGPGTERRPTPSALPSSSPRSRSLRAAGRANCTATSCFRTGVSGLWAWRLEAGLDLVNLTESQFGIGHGAKGFRGTCRAPTSWRCPMSIRAMRRASNTTFWPTIRTRRNWPRTSSGRAISGHSMPPGCSASGRAWSTSPLPAKSAGAAGVHGLQPQSVKPCPAIYLSASTDWTRCRAYLGKAGAGQAQPINRLRQ